MIIILDQTPLQILTNQEQKTSKTKNSLKVNTLHSLSIASFAAGIITSSI